MRSSQSITFTALISAISIAGAAHAQLSIKQETPLDVFVGFQNTDPRDKISSLPFTISQSGSYVLTGDLNGTAGSSGIIVTADNVTIDLNGFTLSGVPGSSRGIDADAAEHVAICNGTVRDWGQEGIHAGSAKSVRLSDLTAASNGGSAGIVMGITGTLQGVVSSDNGGDGFRFSDIAERSFIAVSDCVAHSNGGAGFVSDRTGSVGDASTFENCSAEFNGAQGFNLVFATLRGCTASYNDEGFDLVVSVAADCTASQNTDNGFELFLSNADNCSAHNNGGDGFELARSNTVKNCNAGGNVGDGIHCALERNFIDSNYLLLNGGAGIRSSDLRNIIVRNMSYEHAGGNYVTVGARVGPIQSQDTATSPWANF